MMKQLLARPATLTAEEHRVLSEGRVRLHNTQNVAVGYGKAVLDLTRAGLMRAAWQDDINLLRGSNPWMTYTVTRAGRDAYVSYGPPFVPLTGPTP
jgi:hypothetical protein